MNREPSFPAPGSLLASRYRIVGVLGRGASAVVYRANDTRLGRDIALKVPVAAGDVGSLTDQRRFLHEARALAGLSHPHVVTIHDIGEREDGSVFLVMELLTQGSLEAELAKGPLSAERTLEFLLPVMGALACAHDLGIVHRDLKPANMAMEQRADHSVRLKLLDFGVAKSLTATHTTSGITVGTPAYMAPEQVSLGEVGPFTDVWAMGVTMFRCLAGRLPFDAPTPTGVLLQIVQSRAPRMREVCPDMAPALGAAIDRALERNLSVRYRDMREFARALAAACVEDKIPVTREPDPIGLPRFSSWLAESDATSTAELTTPLAPLAARPEPAASPLSGRALISEPVAVEAPAAALVDSRATRGVPNDTRRGRAWAYAVASVLAAVAIHQVWPSAPARLPSSKQARPASAAPSLTPQQAPTPPAAPELPPRAPAAQSPDPSPAAQAAPPVSPPASASNPPPKHLNKPTKTEARRRKPAAAADVVESDPLLLRDFQP